MILKVNFHSSGHSTTLERLNHIERKEWANTGSVVGLTIIDLPSVIQSDLSAPPSSQYEGAEYLVGGSATGDWAGKEDNIAKNVSDVWTFTAPTTGDTIWIINQNMVYEYDGSGWVNYFQGLHAFDTSGVYTWATIAQHQANNAESVDGMDLAAAKAAKKLEIKDACNLAILALYPLWKQLNLIRAGGTPMTDMGTAIDAIRTDSDTHENTVDAYTVFADIYNFTPSY